MAIFRVRDPAQRCLGGAFRLQAALDETQRRLTALGYAPDQWAQAVEALGDKWGRGIRYGDEPDDPHRRVGLVTRRRIWAAFGDLSDQIDLQETSPLPALEERIREVMRRYSQLADAVD